MAMNACPVKCKKADTLMISAFETEAEGFEFQSNAIKKRPPMVVSFLLAEDEGFEFA